MTELVGVILLGIRGFPLTPSDIAHPTVWLGWLPQNQNQPPPHIGPIPKLSNPFRISSATGGQVLSSCSQPSFISSSQVDGERQAFSCSLNMEASTPVMSRSFALNLIRLQHPSGTTTPAPRLPSLHRPCNPPSHNVVPLPGPLCAGGDFL
jgi:hypothetical protein